MNTEHPSRGGRDDDSGQRFDAAMRALHARALEQVSPDTRMRLRSIRNEAGAAAPRRGGMFAWALASGGVAAFALALGLQFAAGPGEPAGAPALAAVSAATDEAARAPAGVSYDPDTAVAALDENPDLYLWLASNSDALPNH